MTKIRCNVLAVKIRTKPLKSADREVHSCAVHNLTQLYIATGLTKLFAEQRIKRKPFICVNRARVRKLKASTMHFAWFALVI